MTEFLSQFVWMMGFSALAPIGYALSKQKRDFSPRTFLFNTRKRFITALLANLIILVLFTFVPEAQIVLSVILSWVLGATVQAGVYFCAAAVGFLVVIGMRGDVEGVNL